MKKAYRAMPCILAIETSAHLGAVCVLCDGVATTEIMDDGTKHGAWLLPAIDRALKRANRSLTDVNAIAYGQGPGSFTGVRTACATAQALAFARSLPLYAVDSMAAFAHAAFSSLALSSNRPIIETSETINVIFDARMNEAYTSVYLWQFDKELAVIHATKLVPFADLHVRASELAVGGGALLLAKRDGLNAARCETMQQLTQAAENGWAQAIARIAVSRIARGETALDPRDAQPIYVRNNVAKTEAERAREAMAA